MYTTHRWIILFDRFVYKFFVLLILASDDAYFFEDYENDVFEGAFEEGEGRTSEEKAACGRRMLRFRNDNWMTVYRGDRTFDKNGNKTSDMFDAQVYKWVSVKKFI